MEHLRSLNVIINDAQRTCRGCLKSLSGYNDTIVLLLPNTESLMEFCSWRCTVESITHMLDTRLARDKMGSQDILKHLGFAREWGPRIPRDELKRRITNDPAARMVQIHAPDGPVDLTYHRFMRFAQAIATLLKPGNGAHM